jgi:hypothetical protein
MKIDLIHELPLCCVRWADDNSVVVCDDCVVIVRALDIVALAELWDGLAMRRRLGKW